MKTKLLLSSILLVALSMSGCNKSENTSASENDKNVSAPVKTESAPTPAKSNLPDNAPTYQIGTLSSFEPFCFRDEFGKSTGFDVELLTAVGEKAGFKVNFNVTPWEQMLSSLESDSFDAVASAVVITPEREKKYSFSDSYLHSSLSLMVTDKHADKSFDDIIADPNMKYALLSGSTPLKVMENELKIPKENILQYDTQFLAIKAVLSGQADATFEDSNMLKYSAKEFDGLTLIGTEKYPLDLGVVLRQGDTELQEKINFGLSEVKKDGTYNKIYEKWFGQADKSQ